MADTSSRDYDWKALVKAHEGPEHEKREVEYQFSNGRKFQAPATPYQSEIPGQE